MQEIIYLLSCLCLVLGAGFCLTAALGILRFPDFFCRVHGAGILDTLGAGLILLGLMLQAGWTLITVKLIFILVFLFITGPTAVHALARAAHYGGVKPKLGAASSKP